MDGNWSAWSAWSTCSKSCKQGEQSRTRECSSPKPQYGGKKCEGSAREKTVCNKDVPCPGNEVLSSMPSAIYIYIYILYFFLLLLYFVKGSIRFASGQYRFSLTFVDKTLVLWIMI